MSVITKEQLLEFSYSNWKTASPEFKSLWNNVNNLINWRTLTTLYFQNVIVGSEFLTYVPGKLYLAHEFSLGTSGGSLAPGFAYFYDENNIQNQEVQNNSAYWDFTNSFPVHFLNYLLVKNIYFSRIALTNYDHIIFSGYRLNT